MIMSSPIPSREIEPSGIEMSLEMDGSGIIASDDESDPGTAGGKEPSLKQDVEANGRLLGLEPWVWVNTLVESAQGLVKGAVQSKDDYALAARDSDGMETSWVEDEQEWGASINDRGTSGKSISSVTQLYSQ